jgi:hypothetical protein
LTKLPRLLVFLDCASLDQSSKPPVFLEYSDSLRIEAFSLR